MTKISHISWGVYDKGVYDKGFYDIKKNILIKLIYILNRIEFSTVLKTKI